MDKGSLWGLILAVVAVFGGHLLGGGAPVEIVHLTAAFVVLAGTLAAVLVSFPGEDLGNAWAAFPLVFRRVEMGLASSKPLIDEIVKFAGIARKEGLLGVETQSASVQDPAFKRMLKYVTDGYDGAAVQEIIRSEIQLEWQSDLRAVKVFEAAGSVAPAVGVVGAVLGLIHVMSMLDQPSKIGAGIAVAFVSTLYGIALSNLCLNPWATKLRRKAQQKMLPREIVRLGIAGIQDGLNPTFLQEKLEVYARGTA